MRSRSEAIGLVQYVVDDALNGRPLGADPHAIIRTSEMMRFKYESAIVVCECESGTIGVVVHSYLDTRMEEDESVDLAVDYLQEIGETVVETEFHPGDECSTPAMSVERLAQQDSREIYGGEEHDAQADTR